MIPSECDECALKFDDNYTIGDVIDHFNAHISELNEHIDDMTDELWGA